MSIDIYIFFFLTKSSKRDISLVLVDKKFKRPHHFQKVDDSFETF